MKIRCASVVVVSLVLMSVGVSSVAQAASAGGTCKTVGRTVVDSGVNLRCTPTESGLKWRKFTPPVVVSQPVVAAPSVVVTPSVSVESTLLRQPGVISVNSNVVGTVYVAEVSVKVAKVSDIENAGSYLWVSAPITKVGVNEVSVNIDAIINGNYRVYVANDKGVLSTASLNMVVVSMPRLYDSVAAQSWSHQFGSSDIESNPGVAVDAVGNVYVVGSTHSDFVGDIFTSEVYVQKFDASGNEIASIQFGTSDGSAAATVAVDAVGNVYVAGLTRGAFAGNTSQGNTDVFVAKFNSSLVLQGTVQFGTSEDDAVYSVVVDAVGNVNVAGWTKGAFAGYTNPGLNDGFVAKFNSSLVLQGTVQFGTSEDDLAYSVAVDAAGNVYVAGWTDGAFAGYTNQGGEDGFVAKFNSSLVLQGTVKQFGTSEDDLAYSVAVDAAGNVYVAGVTGGALAGSENQGDSDAFVAKFNSSLVLQGTVQFGTLEVDAATSMAVDAAGNVYVVGATFGAMTGNTNQGGFDVFVARFNSSLVLQGIVKQFGTSEYDVAYSVAVDAAGNVYVAGDTAGDLFGPNSGLYDTFVLKEVA